MNHLYEIIQLRAERYASAVALGAEDGLRWRTVAISDGNAARSQIVRDAVHQPE